MSVEMNPAPCNFKTVQKERTGADVKRRPFPPENQIFIPEMAKRSIP